MPRTPRCVLQAIACSAILAAGVLLSTAQAQNSVRTGDGLLSIQAAMPEQARVGGQFTYNVEVMNTSDNVVLHDIHLKQRKAKGLTIESVSIDGQDAQKQANDDKKSNGNSSSQDRKSQQSSQQEGQSQGQSSSDGQSANDASDKMMISALEPGESRTFTVKATADEEGEVRSCLEIASYTPAICLTSQVVKPQLELTKTAPQKANRCNAIELSYTVKNGGSGAVGEFEITDSLGEGLATIDGNRKLSFQVDGLAAGETREFVARVYAQKSGEFSSRATAKANNSDLKSRSKETTTKVLAADLIAHVDGPPRVYGNDLATFTAIVTNDGNVAAESVNVTVNWPSNANLADLSDYEVMKNADSKQSSGEGNNDGQPTLAKKQDTQSQSGGQESGESEGDSMQMQSESFVIDRLEPGQAAEFTYAIRTDNLDEIPTKIQARYVCTVDAAKDQAKSTTKTTTVAMTTAKVVRLPALQLAVVDDEDPVNNGSKVQYTIQVWNEGDAPDQNVQLVATLPSNLKFDSADGPTELKSEGKTVKFAPIKSMKPGDRAEFTVTAKPTGTGNARFEASLKSKMLQSEVIGEEPTRLFSTSKK